MRWGWILTAVFYVSLSAAAQDATNTAQPASTQPAETQSAPPAAVQSVSTTTPGLALSQPGPKTPVSVDQVVDQIIEREHALITFLKNRTPLVETYLQNLTPD